MATAADIATLNAKIAKLQASSDARFTLLTAANCFLMILGFALLEAGSLRSKNLTGVMLKEFVCACVVGFVWYLWGHGMAFGASSTRSVNNFIGTEQYAMSDTNFWDTAPYGDWFFQMTFASVAVSIVSGAIAERMKFLPYFVFLFVGAGWIYPVVAHSVWSANGWNSPFNQQKHTTGAGQIGFTGAVDAAGCAAVHMVGGFSALVGAWMVGARIGRFEQGADGKKVTKTIPGWNLSYTTMGVLLLWYSWFSFNSAGKILDQSNQHLLVGRSGMNTCLSSCMSGITVLVFTSAETGFQQWKLNEILNGVLAGLVSITASSTVVEPWAAFIIGIVGGLGMLFTSWLVSEVFHVDDCVDAFAVHGWGGIWGLFAAGLFAQPDAMRVAYGTTLPNNKAGGAFYAGDGTLLGYQLLAIAFTALWTLFWAWLYFQLVEWTVGLRILPEEEEAGMDQLVFGGQALDFLEQVNQVGRLKMGLDNMHSTLMDGNPTGIETGGGGSNNGDDAAGGAAASSGGDEEMTQFQRAQAARHAAAAGGTGTTPAAAAANDDDEEDLFGGGGTTEPTG